MDIKWSSIGRHSCFEKRYVNFIRADEELDGMFQQFMNLEFSESVSDPTFALSRQDEKVLSIYEESARLLDGYYEIAIPWELHPPGLPNNRPLAEHRLRLLQRRLVKDPELCSRYSAFMSDHVKGYDKRVPEDRRSRDDGKVWYLSHHSLVHPRKPEKVRVVFDCAARYRGTSLNDRVLRGPCRFDKQARWSFVEISRRTVCLDGRYRSYVSSDQGPPR